MKSFIKAIVILLPIVVIVALLALYIFLNRVIQTAVETGGPMLTDTAVTLEDVDLSILSGHGKLEGLVIGNPEGFKTESAMKLGKLEVNVEVRSMASDTIHVREIRIVAPEITVEGLDAKNLKKIQENVAKNSAPSGEPEAEAEEEAPAAEPGKKVIIDRLVVVDGKVNYSPGILMGKSIPIPLPEVELIDLGKESGGATIASVVTEVWTVLLKSVTGALAGSTDQIASGLKGVGNAAGATGEAAAKAAQDSAAAIGDATGAGTEAVTDAAKKLSDGAATLKKGLGGLLPGGDKKSATDAN